MEDIMLLNIGDLVKMRKPHPCGSDLWIVTYVGADVKIRCEKCGRIVMLDRPTFEKRLKKIVNSAEKPNE